MKKQVFRIQPAIKQYAWGKRGESWVQKFADSGWGGEQAEQPFAEVWMGDHPSGCARLDTDFGDNVPEKIKQAANLGDLLRTSPELNGGSPSLPFLGKLLSIAKPLSIQLHPGKQDAGRLRAENSEIYPDDVQKDEASIALSPTRLLYGFRPAADIEEAICGIPEIQNRLQPQLSAGNKTFHRNLCSALFGLDESELAQCGQALVEAAKKQNLGDRVRENAVLKAAEHFGVCDAGLLFCLLLNIVELQPGEAIEIPAKRIHAYLSGDVIEIMRTSDNVIRCGLTPKLKDNNEILRCAEFSGIAAGTGVSSGSMVNAEYLRYRFHGSSRFGSLDVTILGPGSHSLPACVSGSILASLAATGSVRPEFSCDEIESGQCYFIAAETKMELMVLSGRFALFSGDT